MARNNKSDTRSKEQQKGLRDERGRFTEKGAQYYGKEGGMASSRNNTGTRKRKDKRNK